MSAQTPLEQFFDNLDRWRHLPNYQLERRADALFALYLPDLVQERVGRAVSPIIVPELPILCSLLWADRIGKNSVKADYLLLAEDRSEAYLVELKTDASSRRDIQDDYLRLTCECGLQKVLEGVVQIAKASKSRAKYANLLRLLASMGLVEVPSGEPVSKSWFGAVKVLACLTTLKHIYLQPSDGPESEMVISFSSVRRHLARFDDELSTLFAKYLERWTQKPGQLAPADVH